MVANAHARVVNNSFNIQFAVVIRHAFGVALKPAADNAGVV
jgi:hypothetical protein